MGRRAGGRVSANHRRRFAQCVAFDEIDRRMVERDAPIRGGFHVARTTAGTSCELLPPASFAPLQLACQFLETTVVFVDALSEPVYLALRQVVLGTPQQRYGLIVTAVMARELPQLVPTVAVLQPHVLRDLVGFRCKRAHGSQAMGDGPGRHGTFLWQSNAD